MDTHTSKAGKGILNEGRMPCPECRAPIRLPLQSLFSAQPIFCAACGIRLSVDAAASKGALESLKKAQQMLGNIDKAHPSLPGYSSQIGRGGAA